jgi:hypothetical protein
MPASIIFNQVGAPAGVAGNARDDFVTGQVVTCSNAVAATTYLWTFVDTPIRSAITRGSVSTASTLVFTPDVKGTYLISLTVNGSALPADQARSFCAVLTTGVNTKGWRYKAAGETEEDNTTYTGLGFTANVNPRGWATSEDLIYEDVESAVYKVDNAVVVSPGPGTADLVKLDSATGQLDSSVVPTADTTTSINGLGGANITVIGSEITLGFLAINPAQFNSNMTLYYKCRARFIALNGTLEVRLYDVGTGAASSYTPVLRSTHTYTTADSGYVRERSNTLTSVASPSATNEIHNVNHVYEIRGLITSTDPAAVAFVGNAEIYATSF